MEQPGAIHPHLTIELADEVCVLTLAAPERRNAQTPSLWAALEQAARLVEETPRVRVVLLRAEGSSFSAGLDRGMLTPGGIDGEPDLVAESAASPSSGVASVQSCQRGFAALRRLPAVVVAAVQGHAVGAGAELAMSADLRIVADDLALSWPEVRIGLIPDLGATSRLARTVGEVRALEITLTGRVVGAEEAVRLGLANGVVARTELDGAARALVEQILRLPEAAVREMTRLVRGIGERSESEQLEMEAQAQARLLHAAATRAG